ncbi:hypothetical protein ACRE_009460 [Hapsidospora chrysogenum ATCC 11550]|uniref:Uncharacterized protein n=1 Tax=Hapsidospora chrysogenum (strain ATCC 11550 / CBS 779.69 / DSM 880 / IAM 14645 / JCM 23072 / IMI 49137) TaxID=857340 RepID=A0A086TG33_HAPC1|nr:hypothetical protein ACRE_009460 [Hapsidospora chrysogenum ATCC 11550]
MTTSTQSSTSMKPGAQTQVVTGRVVGSGANEPAWSDEQLQHFSSLRSLKLPIVKNLDGTSSATTAAILPTLPFSEFKIGIGDAKPDDKLPKKKLYSDVVIIGMDDNWVLNQSGVHFARFGFPAESLAPVFHTLDSTVNGIINSLIMTDGYYWCNTSCGISHTPGTFAMDMLGTKSSQGVGTFAISLGCEYDKEGDRMIPNLAKYVFSIKCHSFVHFRKTDCYGPPQTASVGVLMNNDMMMMAEPLSKCALPILPPEYNSHDAQDRHVHLLQAHHVDGGGVQDRHRDEPARTAQIEQLSAFTDTGENFSVYMRTTVRTNTSPNLRALPPMLYNALASEPMDAMKRFNSWIKLMHSMNTNGDTNMDNVILAAHSGPYHDHVHLLRTMMRWGITPPEYRFSDTLALFKAMKGMNQRADLPTLVTKAVVMCVFPMVKKACYAFSTSHDDFMKRSGLNMHGIRPVYTLQGHWLGSRTRLWRSPLEPWGVSLSRMPHVNL